MNDLARRLRRGENVQRRAQYRALRLGITDIAERTAERMANGSHARCSDCRLIRRHHAQDDSGDFRFFDYPRHQSHGPATIGSDGGEHGAGDALGVHARRDRRR